MKTFLLGGRESVSVHLTTLKVQKGMIDRLQPIQCFGETRSHRSRQFTLLSSNVPTVPEVDVSNRDTDRIPYMVGTVFANHKNSDVI